MPKPIPVDEMSTEKKLQTMEMLWDALRQRAGEMPSPDWHQDVLQERQEALARGKELIERLGRRQADHQERAPVKIMISFFEKLAPHMAVSKAEIPA